VVAAGGAVNSTSGGETKINRMQGKSFRLAAQQEKSLAATKMVHTHMPLSKRLKRSTKSQSAGEESKVWSPSCWYKVRTSSLVVASYLSHAATTMTFNL
jgi:hypothetical protein